MQNIENVHKAPSAKCFRILTMTLLLSSNMAWSPVMLSLLTLISMRVEMQVAKMFWWVDINLLTMICDLAYTSLAPTDPKMRLLNPAGKELSIHVRIESKAFCLHWNSTQASLYKPTRWSTIRSRFSRASARGPGCFASSEGLNASTLIHVGPAFYGRALGSTCSSVAAVLSKTFGWMNLLRTCFWTSFRKIWTHWWMLSWLTTRKVDIGPMASVVDIELICMAFLYF